MKPQIKYIPLSFLTSETEIKKQLRNTVVFSHLLDQYETTTLSNYLVNSQYGYTASAAATGAHKLVRITDINDGMVDWASVPSCDCDSHEQYLLKENDILIARTGGTTGITFLVKNPPNNAIFASYLIRLRVSNDNSAEFIYAYLNSYIFWSQITKLKSGSAQPNVNAEKIKLLVIPKCDKTVQGKVIQSLNNCADEEVYRNLTDGIEHIENQFDKVRSLSNEISHQQSLLKKLRQAILQEAVQGKLVPQDPNDEPASELLNRIKSEKEKLIAEGKLRKEKPLPLIKEEEIPFALPKGWVWCRLGDCSINRDEDRIPVARNDRVMKEKLYDYYGASGVIDKIDHYTHDGEFLLIGEDGANLVARSTSVAFIAKGKFWVNNHAHVLKFIDHSTLQYTEIFVNAIDLKPYITGGFQPKLSQANLNNINIAFPPLAAQERIVQKVNLLFSNCDQLEKQIEENTKHSEMLLQAVLKEAFETKTVYKTPEHVYRMVAEKK
ncbi:MAG: restriction endonuclease subunit S [Ignavibacteriales bacterium]|nr:restriction endonuclease subunit S [Ignavibacteriales bacterium]